MRVGVMVPWEPSAPRQCGGWTLCDCCCWLLLPAALLLLARPDKLAAFPTSLSDCQTPTGWNCSGESAGERAGPGARGRGVGQSCGLPRVWRELRAAPDVSRPRPSAARGRGLRAAGLLPGTARGCGARLARSRLRESGLVFAVAQGKGDGEKVRGAAGNES